MVRIEGVLSDVMLSEDLECYFSSKVLESLHVVFNKIEESHSVLNFFHWFAHSLFSRNIY